MKPKARHVSFASLRMTILTFVPPFRPSACASLFYAVALLGPNAPASISEK
jgi:hypothetical protein